MHSEAKLFSEDCKDKQVALRTFLLDVLNDVQPELGATAVASTLIEVAFDAFDLENGRHVELSRVEMYDLMDYFFIDHFLRERGLLRASEEGTTTAEHPETGFFVDPDTSTFFSFGTEFSWSKFGQERFGFGCHGIYFRNRFFGSIQEFGKWLGVDDPWSELVVLDRERREFPIGDAKGKALLRRAVHEQDGTYTYNFVVEISDIPKWSLYGEEGDVIRDPNSDRWIWPPHDKRRYPKWLKELLKNGYTLEDLTVFHTTDPSPKR